MEKYEKSWHEEFLPDAELEVCEENLKEFWYWIYERHMIYHRRFVLGLKKSKWTNDPILKEYKFTNVYRELDRVTLWMRENIIDNNDFPSEKSKLFSLIVCRLFNKPETFEIVGIPRYENFNPKVFKLLIEKKIIEKGLSPFTDAYLLNSAAFPGVKKYVAYSKHLTTELLSLIDDFFHVCKNAKNPKEIIREFKRLHSVSDFIAYEFYCDLTYWKGFMKFDLNDYVNVGPGAIMGIRMLFPKSGMNKRDAEKKIYELTRDQHKYFKKYGFEDFPFLQNKYKELTLREIEHSLCEYQKYFKMKHRVGKQRQKFIPKS